MRCFSALSVLLACALVVVAGCRRTPPPATLIGNDAGPAPDTMIPPDLDSDEDGICDFNEIQRRTDPNNPDTDGDGFSDYVEAQNGTNPNDLASPARDILVLMSESETGMVDVPFAFSIRGIGETFTGEITRVATYIADDGTTAFDFYGGSLAIGATPMENVHGGIDGSRYLGVIGRTLLQFTAHFRQSQLPRGCMRAYPFAYTVKADDGSFRATTQRWLVLLPPGMQIGGPDARWCGPVTATCL